MHLHFIKDHHMKASDDNGLHRSVDIFGGRHVHEAHAMADVRHAQAEQGTRMLKLNGAGHNREQQCQDPLLLLGAWLCYITFTCPHEQAQALDGHCHLHKQHGRESVHTCVIKV